MRSWPMRSRDLDLKSLFETPTLPFLYPRTSVSLSSHYYPGHFGCRLNEWTKRGRLIQARKEPSDRSKLLKAPERMGIRLECPVLVLASPSESLAKMSSAPRFSFSASRPTRGRIRAYSRIRGCSRGSGRVRLRVGRGHQPLTRIADPVSSHRLCTKRRLSALRSLSRLCKWKKNYVYVRHRSFLCFMSEPFHPNAT